MGMNIKDPEVHAMARKLAAQRGTSVTDAVRQALLAELERFAEGPEARAAASRRKDLLGLLPRFQQLPWPDGRGSRELQEELYGADGLPV
jgi:antitoxin VapB